MFWYTILYIVEHIHGKEPGGMRQLIKVCNTSQVFIVWIHKTVLPVISKKSPPRLARGLYLLACKMKWIHDETVNKYCLRFMSLTKLPFLNGDTCWNLQKSHSVYTMTNTNFHPCINCFIKHEDKVCSVFECFRMRIGINQTH